MRINGQPFTVSTNSDDNLKRLRASGNNCTLLSEFRPVRLPQSTYIWRLLYHVFFCHVICCFLAGNFVLYMAGLFDSYTDASLFIAMTDSTLLRRIFRQDLDPLDNFYIHGFLFEFSCADDDEDIFYYDISCGDFRMSFVFYGIDTTDNCDTPSNLDFVQFIWLNYECFNFAKYSLTFVRRDYPSLPELLCLKYYRAESTGWTDSIHYGSCVARLQNRLHPVTRCLRPDDCSCTICILHLPPYSLPHPIHSFNWFSSSIGSH
jgi:hypothetical protein